MFSNSIGFYARSVTVAGALALLAACGGGGSGGDGGPPSSTPAPAPTPASTHTVGGTASGLAGTLVLQNNAGDDLKIAADGRFSFATGLVEGAAYQVSVRTQPLWQWCTVGRGSGSASADVSDVEVDCKAVQATVTTIAGSGLAGATNANGTAATFNAPSGIALYHAGNLLVADTLNHLLRKIAPNGDVTTFAGDGSPGSGNGNGTAASFFSPAALSVDTAGNAYVAQLDGGRIRKVTPSGDVTTFAGNSIPGTVDGNGTAASFRDPSSVSIDPSGNLYVTEFSGNTVRKITPSADVSTFAGSGGASFADGMGLAASFNQPIASAVDAAGNIYVADLANHRIRKITPASAVTTFAGSGTQGWDDGVGTAASFAGPSALAVDAEGNLFVIELSGLVRRITTAGVVSTIAGSPLVTGSADGVGPAASFGFALGLTVDAAGTVYVADTQNNLIRKLTPTPSP